MLAREHNHVHADNMAIGAKYRSGEKLGGPRNISLKEAAVMKMLRGVASGNISGGKLMNIALPRRYRAWGRAVTDARHGEIIWGNAAVYSR